MPTKHVDKMIEAYLDRRLSPEVHRRVEAHLQVCPTCARQLFEAQRLVSELGPTMQTALGQPAPPPVLRQKVRSALKAKQAARRSYFNWTAPIRILNAVGTVAVIALLAFGVLTVIRGQIPGTELLSRVTPLGPNRGGGEFTEATPTPTLTVRPEATSSLPREGASLGDTLPARILTPTPIKADIPSTTIPTPLSEIDDRLKTVLASKMEAGTDSATQQTADLSLPGGTIAFALFNMTSDHNQVYEIHLINPDGTDHRKFPLAGVSEPALHPTTNDYPLAFRAWSEPTSPRSLLSSNQAGDQAKSITNFWEDAQPDWSPTENRIIFASQRESDRRWRLYSVWGDGSIEVNLRREGKSPTFAPDGNRFAFESCDNTGNGCGLWVGDLQNSVNESKPFLEDPLAKAPDWSPVAEEIAYMANPDGNWDLYLVNSDGSHVRRLTDDPAIDGLPAWSPDGEWLAFVSNRGEGWGIWLLNVATGQLFQTFAFNGNSLTPPNRLPYNQHGERYWWDEQLSWGK